MATESGKFVPPPPVVALAGWAVPGAGYWLIGERARGVTVGVTILILFFLGILIGGIRVVDAPQIFGGPRQQSLFNRVAQKPWFVGQVLAGAPAIIGAKLASMAEQSPQLGKIRSHARVAEIGTLYTAVAGMLNLMAVIDSAWRASQKASSE